MHAEWKSKWESIAIHAARAARAGDSKTLDGFLWQYYDPEAKAGMTPRARQPCRYRTHDPAEDKVAMP